MLLPTWERTHPFVRRRRRRTSPFGAKYSRREYLVGARPQCPPLRPSRLDQRPAPPLPTHLLRICAGALFFKSLRALFWCSVWKQTRGSPHCAAMARGVQRRSIPGGNPILHEPTGSFLLPTRERPIRSSDAAGGARAPSGRSIPAGSTKAGAPRGKCGAPALILRRARRQGGRGDPKQISRYSSDPARSSCRKCSARDIQRAHRHP